MSNFLNGEEILCSIKTNKTIKNNKNSNIIINTITNLFSIGIAGRITNDFKLTLTNENLYIEATSYCAWGGLPETIYTDKISRKDIQSFEVTTENTAEIIKIIKNDNKTLNFIRDNEKNNYLALEMAKLISNNTKI